MMMTLVKITALPILALALSGCSSPVEFETEPVVVQTPQGAVTCQLYTPGIVAWDRAIDRPATMSVKAGDAYCLNEGARRQQGG